MSLWRDTVLGVSTQPAIQQFVVGHELARPLRDRFVAGEGLDDALAAARALNRAGCRASLDHLGEYVREPAAADAALADYLALVEAIAQAQVDSGISIKLSQLGLTLDQAASQARLERLLAAAQAAGVFVRIDMEGSAHTQATLDVLRAVWPGYHNVGVVLQAYLHRTGRDLEDVLALGATVRLCKGAYREPPNIAYQARDEIDAAYARLTTRMLEAPNYTAIATHDPALIAHARAEAARLGRARDSFEFQMLYGVRRDLQQALVRAGYRVRVYVPYGREWYPYLTRRLAERPGNLLFLVRSLWAEQRGHGTRAA
ncbi:MAG TPA: proline dehydrogenase family protein [Chloroflexota bacterium]|jgi:proline dehydrogenase